MMLINSAGLEVSDASHGSGEGIFTPLSCDPRMFKVHDKVCLEPYMMCKKTPGTFQKCGGTIQIRTILAPRWSSSKAP